MPLILALGRQRQQNLWAWGQLGLYSEFQASYYIKRLSQRNQKQKNHFLCDLFHFVAGAHHVLKITNKKPGFPKFCLLQKQLDRTVWTRALSCIGCLVQRLVSWTTQSLSIMRCELPAVGCSLEMHWCPLGTCLVVLEIHIILRC